MELSAATVSPTAGINNVKICSLFNVKEFNTIINQHNIKISKLMKLNIYNNAHPIHIEKATLNDLDQKIVTSPGLPSTESVAKNEELVSSSSSPLSQSNSAVSIPDMKYCSFCKIGFCDQLEQRQHYKLDWHRYNIKLDIKQKPSVTEQQFTQIMTKNDDIDNDDVSSISGSESDDSSDSDLECSPRKLQPLQKPTGDENVISMSSSGNKTRVIFENNKGNVVALYKCLFLCGGNKVDEVESLTESQYINIFNKLPITLPNSKCLIVMLGGGHFAAAIFKGSEPILHKTFHSYTVRAKQGGSQSSKDNKRTTNAKSAGASLRRYNEQSLLQHVQDILSTWSSEVADCKYLFYRAVGPGNRSILFGGRQPTLDKNDSRLCKIPFPTRRATYSEVKRAHSLLMSLYIYESEETFANIFQLNNSVSSNRQKFVDSPSASPVKKRKEKESVSTANKTNRASKQRQSPSRDDLDEELSDIVNRLRLQSSDEENSLNNKNEFANTINDVNISFGESLQEYGNTPVPKKKKQQLAKNQNSKNTSHVDKEKVIDDYVDNNDDEDVNDENKLRKKKRKKKTDKQKVEGIKDPLVNKLSKKVYLACFNGDFDELRSAFDDYKDIRKESQNDQDDEAISEETADVNGCDINLSCVFNQMMQGGLTLLQNAAKNSQKDIVRFLLENGSDPCARDKKSMTAYDFAPDKDTRNVFRRFMGEFPDKYDYSKSHIPSPLTDSIEKEMLEKKRVLKKAKRQKEKEKRIADEPRRQEEAEKKRFLELSDREKRALAAERRILKAVGNLALTRCYQCAVNITGKVPFEYDNKVFCTMDCLKAHRVMVKKKQL